jgi:hypothetical protein
MKNRITLSYAAVALALCLLPPLAYAEKQKQTAQPLPRIACYRRCDADNKKCFEEGKVSQATCTGTKNICYGLCNDVNPQ